MINRYVLIFLWIGVMSSIQNRFYRKEYDALKAEYEWRVTPYFALFVVIPIIWMATIRGFFADTTAYIRGYSALPASWSELPTFMATQKKDVGFSLLEAIIRILLGSDYVPFLFVIAFFQSISVAALFRKYSTHFVFSVFLFLASTDYISWMFNGIRQFMAVTIILFGTGLMLNERAENNVKRYVELLLLIVLASTMHQSALLMLPFVIISQGEAWNKKTLFFILMVLLAIVFVDRFTDLLDDALQQTQYANVVSDYTAWEDDGTNPIRALVYSIPAIISFLGRNRIKRYGGRLLNFCTNMSIISAGLYWISVVTSGVFLGRLPIYCSLYGYILLPWELDNLFSDNNKKVLWYTAVIGYLLFYYYQMHLTYTMI